MCPVGAPDHVTEGKVKFTLSYRGWQRSLKELVIDHIGDDFSQRLTRQPLLNFALEHLDTFLGTERVAPKTIEIPVSVFRESGSGAVIIAPPDR
jgi:hypothetical protein